MKLQSHILIIYMSLLGICLIFWQHSGRLSERSEQDKINHALFTGEITRIRNQIDKLELEVEKHKVDDERAQLNEERNRDDIKNLKANFNGIHKSLVSHCKGAK